MTYAPTFGPHGLSEEERFAAKVAFAGTDECWLWLGAHKAAGYGHFSVKRGDKWRGAIAHRYAYEVWVGPIPAGYEIDHLCHTRACVNPAHLEPVSVAENRRRRDARQGHGPDRTQCREGHVLAEVGYAVENGVKRCNACRAARARERRARRQG